MRESYQSQLSDVSTYLPKATVVHKHINELLYCLEHSKKSSYSSPCSRQRGLILWNYCQAHRLILFPNFQCGLFFIVHGELHRDAVLGTNFIMLIQVLSMVNFRVIIILC